MTFNIRTIFKNFPKKKLWRWNVTKCQWLKKRKEKLPVICGLTKCQDLNKYTVQPTVLEIHSRQGLFFFFLDSKVNKSGSLFEQQYPQPTAIISWEKTIQISIFCVISKIYEISHLILRVDSENNDSVTMCQIYLELKCSSNCLYSAIFVIIFQLLILVAGIPASGRRSR